MEVSLVSASVACSLVCGIIFVLYNISGLVAAIRPRGDALCRSI